MDVVREVACNFNQFQMPTRGIKKFQKNVNRCLILGVRWMDRVRNEDLLEIADQISMGVDIKKKSGGNG